MQEASATTHFDIWFDCPYCAKYVVNILEMVAVFLSLVTDAVVTVDKMSKKQPFRLIISKLTKQSY